MSPLQEPQCKNMYSSRLKYIPGARFTEVMSMKYCSTCMDTQGLHFLHIGLCRKIEHSTCSVLIVIDQFVAMYQFMLSVHVTRHCICSKSNLMGLVTKLFDNLSGSSPTNIGSKMITPARMFLPD